MTLTKATSPASKSLKYVIKLIIPLQLPLQPSRISQPKI